jgi:capsid protein
VTDVRTPSRSEEVGKVIVEGGHGKYTSLGYRSAAVATREGRSYSEGSADMHLEYDRPKLIGQSRAFYRDNAIYRGIIDRAVSYIVGQGFGLRVLIDDPEAGQKLERAWSRMHKTSDIRGLVTGADADAMVCREAMICGDTGAIKRDRGLLQYVEAEQITTGRYGSTGISMDADGKPTAYHVCPYSPTGRLSTSKGKPIPASDFLFFTTPGRPSQTRGEPALQASFPMVHRINDVCDSEAIAWQMLSRIVLSVTRELGEQKAWNESTPDPNKSATDNPGDIAARLMELDYAIIYHGRPGDEVKGIERNIPGENFTQSLRTFLRLLGLPIGMPLELILLDWSQANYSQSRAVLEQAYQTFCAWQERLKERYYQPLFDWRLPALLKAAGVAVDKESIVTEWITPTFPWIDQLKEAQAHAVKIERCLTTHAHVLKELNLDRETVVTARAAEIVDAIKRAQQIKAEHGVDVPWQLFCGLEVPKAAVPADPTRKETSDDKSEDQDQEKNDE